MFLSFGSAPVRAYVISTFPFVGAAASVSAGVWLGMSYDVALLATCIPLAGFAVAAYLKNWQIFPNACAALAAIGAFVFYGFSVQTPVLAIWLVASFGLAVCAALTVAHHRRGKGREVSLVGRSVFEWILYQGFFSSLFVALLWRDPLDPLRFHLYALTIFGSVLALLFVWSLAAALKGGTSKKKNAGS